MYTYTYSVLSSTSKKLRKYKYLILRVFILAGYPFVWTGREEKTKNSIQRGILPKKVFNKQL